MLGFRVISRSSRKQSQRGQARPCRRDSASHWHWPLVDPDLFPPYAHAGLRDGTTAALPARRRVALRTVMLPDVQPPANARAGVSDGVADRVGLGRPVRDAVARRARAAPDAVPPAGPPCRRRVPRCRLAAAAVPPLPPLPPLAVPPLPPLPPLAVAAVPPLPPLAVPPLALPPLPPSLPVPPNAVRRVAPLVLPPLVVPAIGMSVEPAVLEPDVPFTIAAGTPRSPPEPPVSSPSPASAPS